MNLFKKYRNYFLFTIVGAGIGWMGYKFIGCTTGMCFFLHPVSSALKGAAIGLIFAFNPEHFRKKED